MKSRALLAVTLAGFLGACVSVDPDAYSFIVTRQTESIVAVRLIDVHTGQAVQGASLYALQVRFAPFRKHVPQVRWTRVPLRPDGQGNHVYERGDFRRGQVGTFVAHLPGRLSELQGTARIP
jgi:hypothetical protein